MLLSDVGASAAISSDTISFDDQAATGAPDPLVAGAYRPTNVDDMVPDLLPAPAPAPPFGAALSVFNLPDANGSWSLYALDDDADGTGGINGIAGWSLTIRTRRPATTFPDYVEVREGGGPARLRVRRPTLPARYSRTVEQPSRPRVSSGARRLAAIRTT